MQKVYLLKFTSKDIMKYTKYIFLLFCFAFLTWCQSTSIQSNNDTQASELVVEVSQKTIFALWDSLTAGYQLPIEDSYPSQLQKMLKQRWYDVKVINGWHSGDTSAQLLQRLSRNTADAQSGDVVLLVIGANDGLQWLNLTQLEQNIRKIIVELQKKDLMIVIWGMQLPLNQGAEYRETFTSIYPTLASEYNLPIIPFFLEWVAWEASLNLPDGIHPTKEGYTLIANNIADFLEEQILPQE